MSVLAHSNSERADYRSALLVSCAAHFLLFTLIAVRAFMLPSEPIDLRESIRVDIVGLPDKINPAELPPESVAAPPITKPPAVAEPVPAPAKPTLPTKAEPPPRMQNRAQNNALKKLEALNKIEKMVQNQAQKDAEANAAARAATLRGNQVSPGTALSGLARVENDEYTLKLRHHIAKFWSLPEWLAKAGLKAVVIVYIDETGSVTKRVFLHGSGNTLFDERVLEAVDQASPLPAPPRRLVDRIAVDGLKLRFPEE